MATSTIPMAAESLQDVTLTLDTSKVAIRNWGRVAARKAGSLLIISGHGLYTLTSIGDETQVGTLSGVSGVPSCSVAMKVDGQSEPGIAMVSGNTLRLINIQHADKATYFTLVAPLV